MKQVNSNNFHEEVILSDIPVLVDFTAPWCPPCRALKPTLENLSENAAGKFKVVYVDVDKSQDLAIKYDVTAIPYLVLIRDGQIKNTASGLLSRETLLKFIES